MKTDEWVEYVEPERTLLHEVLVFENRWCGHQTKLAVKEHGYRKVTTLCGIFVAEASYIDNGSHYGWDWDGPETETWGVYDPPSEFYPPLCKRCFP